MGERLETITTSTKDVDGLQQVVAHIKAAASKQMPDTHAPRPTPPRRRTTSGPSLAFTPMVKLKPTKSLDLPVALQDALRYAGLPFNQDSIEALQDAVVSAQGQREKKLHDHFNTTSITSHERLSERSSKADSDLQVVRDALYKHTPFQQVSLTDPQVEEQLKALDRELEAKGRELLEAEGNELSLSDPKVRTFIAKYGK
jgi:hypothetical protein